MSAAADDTLSGKQQLSDKKNQILLVPNVEVYEMEIGGQDRGLLYEGPIFVDYATAGGTSKKAEDPDIFLTAGPLCIELCPERNCIAAAPGVYMLSSDEGTYFYCLALGTSKKNVECVTKMHFLFKESCYFQKAPGYEEAADRLGVHPEEDDDPKILWMSSKKISGGIAAVTNGLVWTLSESSKAIGSGISGSANFLVDSGIVRSSPYESRVNPGVKQTLEVVADGCQKTRDGILWAIKAVVEGTVNRGLDAGESMNKTKDGKQKPQSESARALSRIGGQMLHTWFDVGDAVEDAVGDICIISAKATEKLIETQNGEKAAAAARDAFNATGSVMGTALGYRLYRRPAEGRLASTSQANAAASSSAAPPPSSSSSDPAAETKTSPASEKSDEAGSTTPRPKNDSSSTVPIGKEQNELNKSEWPELGATNGGSDSSGGKAS